MVHVKWLDLEIVIYVYVEAFIRELTAKYVTIKETKFKININLWLLADSNACTNNPCLNGATCQVTGTGTTFNCICSTYYTGTYCQTCMLYKNEWKVTLN